MHHFNINIATGRSYSSWLTDKVMQTEPTLRFTIEYPLTNARAVEVTHADGTGWTKKQFVEVVCQFYQETYREEGDDPGLLPGMLNRARSHGKYGIWGHGIEDLVLEGAVRLPDGRWDLGVGS